MQVLIVKISSMGDILHTLPSLTDAIQSIPDIHFDWIVEEDFIQIPSLHEAVDRVIPIAIRRWKKYWFSKLARNERKEFCQKIQSKKYDIIIDAQGLLKSASLLTILSIGVKHGMNWKTVHEPLASLFYDCHHHVEKQQHAVERIRDLFAKSLGYLKPKTQGDYAISKHFYGKKNLQSSPYVIFLHSTTRDDKCWPETNWRKLIQLIQFYNNICIKLLWWNEHEYRRAERLAIGFSHVEVLPKLSLIQVAKKIASAEAVVSVDTGLSHLAAALNQNNITMFGPTDPKLIGGYGRNQYHAVSPTKKMKDLTADEVFHLFKSIFLYNPIS